MAWWCTGVVWAPRACWLLLGGAQAAVHLVLSAMAPVTGTAAAAHVHEGLPAGLGAGGAVVAHGHLPGAGMLLLHVAATVLTALLLARAEDVLWRVVTLLLPRYAGRVRVPSRGPPRRRPGRRRAQRARAASARGSRPTRRARLSRCPEVAGRLARRPPTERPAGTDGCRRDAEETLRAPHPSATRRVALTAALAALTLGVAGCGTTSTTSGADPSTSAARPLTLEDGWVKAVDVPMPDASPSMSTSPSATESGDGDGDAAEGMDTAWTRRCR